MKATSEIDHLIETLSLSAASLEPTAIEEVRAFIKESQHQSGAFKDRGGDADWYYSFFGYMLCKAFTMEEELRNLENYVVTTQVGNSKNVVDWAVWSLLYYSYRPRFWFKVRTSVKLVLLWMKGHKQINSIYITFFTLLLLNHFWGWSKCISRQTDQLTNKFFINGQSPTSHLAAALCIRSRAGLVQGKVLELLMKNNHEDGGFGAFANQPFADMLSTGVTTFSLNRAGINFREICPKGIDFVTRQFEKGAFLSGDGDSTRDIEYTFYGLLALSSYIQQLNITQY